MSTAIGVPLYRAGDKIARAEPTEAEEEKLAQGREATATATAAAAASAEEALEGSGNHDDSTAMQGRVFEVGVAAYSSDDAWGDEAEEYGGEGADPVEEGGFFRAGVAQYGEGPAAPEDEGTPEVRECAREREPREIGRLVISILVAEISFSVESVAVTFCFSLLSTLAR